jgi:4-amino-4-deoxy-L-arabinose transferase-like glycosyltransferase
MDVARNQHKTAVFPPILWPLLILLVAAALRLYALGSIPPGLTHDEADHGITAWSIVNGTRSIYFTIGYGREPFYDYATAVLMRLMGPTYLAGRLTAVFFSLLLVATLYSWVCRAFDRPTALLTAASLATSFWPLMTSRQALRSTILPTLFALAVWFFWQGLKKLEIGDWRLEIKEQSPISNLQSPIPFFILSGLFLGISFYTYIPARVLWGVVPATAVYLMLARRQKLAAVWSGVLLTLLTGLLLATPLLRYLYHNPSTEVRIDELQAPLTAASNGNFASLLHNIQSGLRLLTVAGDPTARYNIPGRPLLTPLMGFLFYLGLLVAMGQVARSFKQQTRQPLTNPATAACLALVWLLAGLSPSLITGSEWSTTQAIGMQPILYLFPALGILQLVRFGFGLGQLASGPVVGWGLIGLLWAATAVNASNDYFNHWANDPNVRVQYEATMMAAMDYLNHHGNGEVAISTITPNEPHTPALAQITLHNPSVMAHWFDGRNSLLIPNSANSTLVVPGFTPLPPPLARYLAATEPAATLPLRPTDLDRPLTVYRVNAAALLAHIQSQLIPPAAPTRFGDALTFLGYGVAPATATPGSVVQVLTLWQVERPLSHAQLFSHLLGSDGSPIAQADLLGVPGETWQPGDRFLQLHELWIKPETAVGRYNLTIGLYTISNGQRQPVLINNQPQGDSLPLTSLAIANP